MSTEIRHIFFTSCLFFGLRRDRVFKALAHGPQLSFPSCSRVESKLINTDTQVKFPYYRWVRLVGGGGGGRKGVGSVRMVMEECPPDGLGRFDCVKSKRSHRV